VLLENQADIAAGETQFTRPHLPDWGAEQADLTFIGLDQPGQTAEQGGLAGTARSEQHDDLAGRHAKVDLAEHRLAAVAFAKPSDIDRLRDQISLRRIQALI